MSFRNIIVLIACCYLVAQSARGARVLHIDNTLVEYTLTKKETLRKILTKRGYPLNDWYDKILKVNKLTKEDRLKVGQTILVPKEVVYFTDAQAETDEELADFIDDELGLGQAGLLKSEARYAGPTSILGNHFSQRAHLELFTFENAMKNGANAVAPYNFGLNYALIIEQGLNMDARGWHSFGVSATLGMYSDADISRSRRDGAMSNAFKAQAFANYQLGTIINLKPFMEFTHQDNIISLPSNKYTTRTDRALWAGIGVHKDFYINDSLLNIELEMAHTFISKDQNSIAVRKLSGYRFTLRPELSLADNNFLTGTIEKSFFPANDLKNTTFGIGMGRFF